MGGRSRALPLITLPALLAVGLWLYGPIPQDPAYHDFADRRGGLGIPNFGDVVSNLPFLLVGLAGLWRCRHVPAAAASRTEWICFFLGISFIALGSGAYHWSPSDASLVWDRLPMTVSFMAFTVALLTERVSPGFSRWLAPALLIGASSVAWWVYTGDLRFYGWVQFAPALVIIGLLLLYPDRDGSTFWICLAMAGYGLAKYLEWADHGIFVATGGLISGHTLKHLSAAAGAACLLGMPVFRQRIL